MSKRYFQQVGAAQTKSFIYKGRRVAIREGMIETTDEVVAEALAGSANYEEVDAPAPAEPAPTNPDTAALLAGMTPEKKDSTENTTKVGISTSGALDALKKQNS